MAQLAREQLIEYGVELKSSLKESEEEVFSLKRKNKILEQRLSRYEPKEGSSADYNGYKIGWPYVRKVQFILQRNFGSLTSRQILDEFLKLEPLYRQAWVDPLNCLSKILGRACKHELMEKIKIPGSIGLFYRLLKNKKEEKYKISVENIQ